MWLCFNLGGSSSICVIWLLAADSKGISCRGGVLGAFMRHEIQIRVGSWARPAGLVG
jgi:hypothetical protein